ncbi:MAG: hypothetical protein JOZ21_00620 [Verrucomicrobia bacterium]|nr:hypothetical protein [Verrucomicrobiota bacterium]
MSLIILQTGCLHGNIYPVSLSHSAPRQTYQYISAYVRSVREEAAKTGAEVVLFDSGNSLSGSFASEVLDAENVATFFNKVGYDAIVLGNQDIRLTKRSLREVQAPMLVPFRSERSGDPPAPRNESIVLKKGGLEVRLFAAFCPDESSGWPLTPGSVPTEVDAVRVPVINQTSHGRPTLNVCLALNADFSRQPELVDRLVQTGADVLLGQTVDTRSEADPPTDASLAGVVLSQNFCFGRGETYVARIDLHKTPNGWRADRKQLVRMRGDVVHADKGVVEAIVPLGQRLAAANHPVVRLDQPKDSSAIREIIGRALDRIQPDAGWLLPEGDTGAIWEPGPLYLSDIFDAMPWDDQIVVLTGLRPDYSELSKHYWMRPIGETGALITLQSIADRLTGGQGSAGSNVQTKETGKKVYEVVAKLLSD